MTNYDELLYMVRMKDESSLKELLQRLQGPIEIGINRQVAVFPAIVHYREDLRMEAQISILRAIESYQEDVACSFLTFATVVINNRIKQCSRRIARNNSGMNVNTVSLDAETEEISAMSNLIASRDSLGLPEYRLRFNEAHERYNECRSRMSETEEKICDAWIEGGTYIMESGKLGMTVRQYEHRLRRVKQKVKDAVEGKGRAGR